MRAPREWPNGSRMTKVLGTIFENPSATDARNNIIERGRQFRMRVAAAQLLDDFDQTVRTRFPYPVAFRWRSLEAHRSGTEQERTYKAVLDTFEVLLCYVAQLGLVMGRASGVEPGALGAIRDKLRSGRSGPSLGDWVAVLEEIAQRGEYRRLSDETPLSEVRGFLTRDADVTEARRRLTERRNAQAHQRSLSHAELDSGCAEAYDDLRLLVERAMFLVDMQLVHVVSELRGQSWQSSAVTVRILMGDHPVVPFHHERSDRNDLEAGSLYVSDRQGRLHLARPFIGRECPQCQTWSTFHVDLCRESSPQLKSLEHGHSLVADIAPALRHVGLL